MARIKIFIAFIFLTFSAIKLYGQTSRISLTLQVEKVLNKLPKKKDDWFSVSFVCTIKNNSSDTIYFVNPEAYKIFPHPWTISINGKDANFWPGDIMCAPSFKKEDIIKLAPKDTISKQFDWHTFVANFSQKKGTYKAKVKYSFLDSKTSTMGADKTLLTDLKSNYSNEVTFKIVD
jgi:hypothetical protein